jgi:hypothetical protein
MGRASGFRSMPRALVEMERHGVDERLDQANARRHRDRTGEQVGTLNATPKCKSANVNVFNSNRFIRVSSMCTSGVPYVVGACCAAKIGAIDGF